jgi:hypothetical protein
MAYLVAYSTYFTPFWSMAIMHSEPDLNRLYAALFLSGLLHAILVLAPLPSADSHAPDSVLTDTTHILNARLYSGTDGKITSPVPGTNDREAAASTAPRENKAGLDETRNQAKEQSSPSAPKAPFFPADQLTRHPRSKDKIDLNIPEARLLTDPGSLVLNLWIDNLGKVVSVEIDKTDLPEEYATAVAETFSQVRFEPGEIHGRPVRSILRIEITHGNVSPSQP